MTLRILPWDSKYNLNRETMEDIISEVSSLIEEGLKNKYGFRYERIFISYNKYPKGVQLLKFSVIDDEFILIARYRSLQTLIEDSAKKYGNFRFDSKILESDSVFAKVIVRFKFKEDIIKVINDFLTLRRDNHKGGFENENGKFFIEQ